MSGRKPRDAAYAAYAIAKVAPALAARQMGRANGELTAEDVAGFLANGPAHALLECFDGAGSRWAPWLIAAVPDLAEIGAYKTDYRTALYRCLRHGLQARIVSRSGVGVAESLQVWRDRLAERVPYNRKQHAKLLAAGVETFEDLSMRTQADRVQKVARTVLDCFNLFLRHLTTAGVTAIEDAEPGHWYGGPHSFYGALKAKRELGMTRYYRAVDGWQILAADYPDVFRATIPTPAKDSEIFLPPDKRPPLLRAMLAEIHAAIDGAPSTHKWIDDTVVRHCGHFWRHHGLDFDRMCAGLPSPVHLALLLFAPQTLPPSGLVPTVAKVIAHIQEPSPERDQQLMTVGFNLRLHRATSIHAALAPNVLVEEFLDRTLKREKLGVAEIYVKAYKAINTHYLKCDKSQLDWLAEWGKKVRKKQKARKKPTQRAAEKAALNRDPMLWRKLFDARGKLTDYRRRMRIEMDREPANTYRSMRWATAVRDELLFVFLQSCPFRTENVLGLQLFDSIDPDTGIIRLSADLTKMANEIFRTLPEAGKFAALRDLLLLYLGEARAIILAGRPESPYLFLTNPKEVDVVDERGDLRAGKDALRAVIRKLTQRHFGTLLKPLGLDHLTTHAFRHMFVTYAAHVRSVGLEFGAKAIGDTEDVADVNYNANTHGIVEDARLWAFMEDVMAEDETDQDLQKAIEKDLGIKLTKDAYSRLKRKFAAAHRRGER